MEKVKSQAKKWLCISIALMLLCCIVVSAVQTSSGKVDMQELMFETDAGYTMSAYIFIPEGVNADNPAPAIVTSHGYLNNKEMQDANYVELARRGFVVLAIDQPCHGDSEILAINTASGVYQGALALSRMPFVDAERIGVTGHSMGGKSCNAAIASDNAADEQVIAAVLLNCADATYVDEDGNWANVYGNRDVGIMAAKYDEFFHMYTDAQGIFREAPYFLAGVNSQSFLNFGVDPAGLEARVADTVYYQEIDGKEAMRVIYNPNIIHPWSHFSARATAAVIDFFTEALDAPNPIASSNQVWQWKEAFNFVGLVGFAIFVCAFGTMMLYTPTFESLRAAEVVQPAKVKDGKGKRWFWLSLIAGALFAMLIYRWILKTGTAMKVDQTEAMGLGLWSTLCGVFTILSMVIFYYCYGKKNGMDLAELGVKISLKKLGLSALLAAIVVVVSYGCIFVADYFFYADFRIWTLTLKAFEAPILKYLPYGFLFVAYYVSNSVATNCFNYNNIGGKFNGIIVAVMAALPALVLPWIQYITYYSTGAMKWAGSAMHILWLFPIVLILFASTIMNRVLYKVTKNPYIAGIINAAIITLLTITNTCTVPM